MIFFAFFKHIAQLGTKQNTSINVKKTVLLEAPFDDHFVDHGDSDRKYREYLLSVWDAVVCKPISCSLNVSSLDIQFVHLYARARIKIPLILIDFMPAM